MVKEVEFFIRSCCKFIIRVVNGDRNQVFHTSCCKFMIRVVNGNINQFFHT